MEEVQNQGETPEIAAPTTETTQDQAQTQAATAESKNARDWRELRRAKEELERKARMQEEVIARLMSQQPTTQSQPAQPEEDIIATIQKEEYVPGEKVAKGFQALQKQFKQELQEIKKQYETKELGSAYSDLRKEFPDLDEIVNPETLKILAQKNPRLANAWKNLDDYSIAVQAYPYIKNSGILDQLPGERRIQEVDKKLDANQKKAPPPTMPDPSQRTMAQAFLIKDPKKEALYREMINSAARVGGSY